MNPSISAPEAALAQQLVLGKGSVHSSDCVYCCLDFLVDGWFGGKWSPGKLVVELPCSIVARLRHDGEQQRPLIFQTDRGQPSLRDQTAASTNHEVRPFHDQGAFGAADLDTNTVDILLERLVTENSNGPAGEGFVQTTLQFGGGPAEHHVALSFDHAVVLSAEAAGTQHPAACMALPSHSE